MRVLLLLPLLLSCAPAVHGGGSDPLHVLTWNIFAGNDLERRSNLSRVAALADSVGADFVLLQEVDRRTRRSGGVDQPAELARLTGMHVVFAPAMSFDGGEFGIALLSRWPVTDSRVVPLEIPPRGEGSPPEPRTLLHAIAQTPLGPVHVINTHVDHQGDPTFRRLQLVRLLSHVAEAVPRNARIVLGGDFNARPDAHEVRALGVRFDDAWRVCGDGEGNTFRSDSPDRRIDYIMLGALGCTRAEVLDRTISDHRPVLVEVVPR